MQWFGTAVRLEQFEETDTLRFRATRERRLGALIVPVAIGMAMAYAWWVGAGGLALLGAGVFLGVPIWNWFKVRVTELRITELELVAEGDLGISAEMVWVQWSAITSLQHLHGDKDEPDGLYALRGFGDRVCLVPHVSDAQAGEMIHAIYSRFPYVAMVEAAETPSLAGKRSEPITVELLRDDSESHRS